MAWQTPYHFPNEDESAAKVREHLAPQFEYANRLLQFWVEAEKDQWLIESGLPVIVLHLAMAFHTQACRQFRTIIEDCGRCESFNAEIAARGLFETILALMFVTKPKVHLITLPEMNKQTNQQKTTSDGRLKYAVRRPGGKYRRSKGNLLSQELRANLYFANIIFQHEAHAKKCRNTVGAKRVGRNLETMTDPAQVQIAESSIGPIWTYILRSAGAYSGLSVADLCQLLDRDLFRWYVKIYGPQSNLIHGAMAVIHTRKNDDDTLGSAFVSTEEDVCRVLMVGCISFRIIVAELQRNIGFGPDMEARINELIDEFLRVFRQDPQK